MRSISDKTIQMLKAVCRRAVDISGGPENFQHCTRVGQAQLSRYTLPSPDFAKYLMPIDVALEADLEAGMPIIVSELARLQGYRLVRDDVAHDVEALAYRDIGELNRGFGALLNAAFEALEDGNVDPREKRVLQRLLDEFMKVMTVFADRVEGRSE
ncbi:hypothetical protein [Martelella mediterranea]|uniref:Uncharacterized protein n=1 Tax=Martelella mediterranea TaxID=293089 RepID=A0A4R3NUQ5_9HYPH|nr:hypothetical protein [Martelella mediterranea]TCT37275.1 hypothetical protein EDC90_101912 [Martelella mediterranea]